MKRTELVTYMYGKNRRVYINADGRIYYRSHGQWCGTFIAYCVRFVDNASYKARYDHDAKVNPWAIVKSWYECGEEKAEVIARFADELGCTFYMIDSFPMNNANRTD